MRIRKRDLSRRVNGNLAVEFGDERLTSFAGLEILMRYLRQLDLNGRLRNAFRSVSFHSDYPWIAMIRLVVGLTSIGGKRLRHIQFLMQDPMMQRFTGLQILPTARTLSRWLQQFNSKTLECFARFNMQLVLDRVRNLGLQTLTIDVDGSVVSTGLTVSWAFRGHNPHHRKVPSYYPILAHLAQTGQILQVKNRPGNIHDGKRALSFLRTLIRADFEAALDRCEVLVAPVAPTTAFKIGARMADPLEMYLTDVFTNSVNLAVLPALSLPCGIDGAGLPIGLQVIGRAFVHATVLLVASAA